MISQIKPGYIFYGIVIVIIIAIVIYITYLFASDDVSEFQSNFDNKMYGVRSQGDRQTAANYLSEVSNKVTMLVTYMRDNGLPDPRTAAMLYDRWMGCTLKETSSGSKSVAFTVLKGHIIRLCIRDENGNFEDPNTAMFVILHELAHVMSTSFGHTEEFSKNFSYITHLASHIGVYKPEMFNIRPKKYCGISIDNTPCSYGTCSFGS